jgi:voltage-gated potassium channel
MKRFALYAAWAAGLRNPFFRLELAIMVGLALVAVGTTGYIVIEHYSTLDALYMTVITLSSVGFETVRPLDAAGKIFTIGLILVGLGTAAWVFATIVEVFVSEQSLQIIGKRRMDRVVDSLKDHYIVCGYGRIGRQIAQVYTQSGVDFVVIERNETRAEDLRAKNIAHVVGDAADDDVLNRAGIARAAGLIAVTPTDADNTFIVLSARGLRPDLFIVARADTIQNEAKLLRAGASKVVSPHTLGGRWMGVTALNPAVTDFIAAMTEAEQQDYLLREFTVATESKFAGQTFGEAGLKASTGALIVAIRRGAPPRHFVPNPPDDVPLNPGVGLIAIGSPKQLQALARLVNPSSPMEIFPRGMRAGRGG